MIAYAQRPLEVMYPIVYFDTLRLKIRDEGAIKNKAVYLALGIRADGRKEVLGLWIEQTEGAKFWPKVFNELKNRGLHDIEKDWKMPPITWRQAINQFAILFSERFTAVIN